MENYIQADQKVFQTYREEMISLYIDAFYQDNHSKKLRKNTAEYFESIFECGYGIVCINNHKLIAAMLITPPEFDKMMPLEIRESINLKKSLYIAELFVDKNMRGKGYGKQLMNYFFKTVKKTHSTFIIRVLLENTAAIHLYKKYLFEAKMTILEEGSDLKGNSIKREKIYLIRHGSNTRIRVQQ